MALSIGGSIPSRGRPFHRVRHRQRKLTRPSCQCKLTFMGEEIETASVVIVGAGPTGLMLAIELCLGGVTPVVLEQLSEISDIPKGNGFFGLIVPVLDYRGLLEPLRTEATYAGPVPRFFFGPLTLDFSGLDTSPLQVLAAPQRTIDRKLAERLTELGGTVRRGHELTGLSSRRGVSGGRPTEQR